MAGRAAGSLPFPGKAPGTVNPNMPFDHIVIVMMENHSFDNLLGALPLTHPDADGLTFKNGAPTNSNPGAGPNAPAVTSFALNTTAQGPHVTQSWQATHQQINGGRMNGFVTSGGMKQPMSYYPPQVLPFAYALASKFTLANRWFCPVPGPTYPNRRFLLAGTAYGGTVTDAQSLLDDPPPNGTICDKLSDHDINWSVYFSDMPFTAVIPSIVENHLDHHHPISEFFDACKGGTLPAVSFVDPRIGLLSEIGKPLTTLPVLGQIGADLAGGDTPQTEEDPQDMYDGEAWAHSVVQAVLSSPVWKRTLLIYTYDEHGGYYDHVPPPAAIPPDDIPPSVQPPDASAAYNMYGPRVPAIVVSPYSRPSGVTNVVHDHTSVLATLEAKWNLPALTNRDANAETVMDFLDVNNAALAVPPAIPGPSTTGPSGPATPAS
jgi:phospholipase C